MKPRSPRLWVVLVSLLAIGGGLLTGLPAHPGAGGTAAAASAGSGGGANGTAAPVGNFSAAINRLVELVGAAGAGLLALVWARVAMSWFSTDVSKKIQAKDRARDALIGTLIFTAALTGLIYGLAHWVLTGA
ncbi:MAG: hypothetical protein ACYCPV_04685 [Thermoplasmata archaeon]|jgi:hypothetical protein